jgi:hypothetical protein
VQTMADLKGIFRRGVAARHAGNGFDEIPFNCASGSFEEWHECANAWADWWLSEDAGREEEMQARFRVQFWYRAQAEEPRDATARHSELADPRRRERRRQEDRSRGRRWLCTMAVEAKNLGRCSRTNVSFRVVQDQKGYSGTQIAGLSTSGDPIHNSPDQPRTTHSQNHNWFQIG